MTHSGKTVEVAAGTVSLHRSSPPPVMAISILSSPSALALIGKRSCCQSCCHCQGYDFAHFFHNHLPPLKYDRMLYKLLIEYISALPLRAQATDPRFALSPLSQLLLFHFAYALNYFFIFGSSASLSPSPKRLKDRMMRLMRAAGKITR